MSHKNITYIHPDAFKGFINLKILNINNNLIKDLSINIFSDLSNLEELSMESLDISSLSVGVFNGLNNLKYLWLQNNKISSLPQSIFYPFSNTLNIVNLKETELQPENLQKLHRGNRGGARERQYR